MNKTNNSTINTNETKYLTVVRVTYELNNGQVFVTESVNRDITLYVNKFPVCTVSVDRNHHYYSLACWERLDEDMIEIYRTFMERYFNVIPLDVYNSLADIPYGRFTIIASQLYAKRFPISNDNIVDYNVETLTRNK